MNLYINTNNVEMMAKTNGNTNTESLEEGDQVDYILKLLESLPQQSRVKVLEEIKNRLSLNKNKEPNSTNESSSSIDVPTISKATTSTKVVEKVSTSNITNSVTSNILNFTLELNKKSNDDEISSHSTIPIEEDFENDEPVLISSENESVNQEINNDDQSKNRKRSTPRRIDTIDRDYVQDDKIIKGCFVSLQKQTFLDPFIKVLETKKSRNRNYEGDNGQAGTSNQILGTKSQNHVSNQVVIAKIKKKQRGPKKPKNYCEICHIQYQSYKGYVKHRLTHTGQRPFACIHCGKRFAMKYTMDVHVRRHENNKPFKCSLCDYRGVVKIEVLKHMATHTGKKDYVCEHCGKTFLNKSRLKTHAKNVHADDNAVCEVCGYSAKSKLYLQRHNIAVHTDHEVYECPICDKIIRQKVVFKSHLEKHTGLTPFGCDTCGKKFPNKSRLGLHIKTHEKATIFCNICDKTFKTMNHLKQHVIIHTTKKPFSCHICNYSCNVRGNLTKHVRLVHQIPDFKLRKGPEESSADTKDAYEREEDKQNILEKGLNVLEQVLKKTFIISGKEFTIEELKKIDEKRKTNDKNKYRIFNPEKRKRGRPKKAILLDPKASRLAEEDKLNEEQSSSSLKDVPSSSSKDNSRTIFDVEDFNQYIFHVGVEEDEVEVPIEADEEEKKLNMFIIEVTSDEELDNVNSEGNSR